MVLTIFMLGTRQTALGQERISLKQQRAKNAICAVFGQYCRQALTVTWCESRWKTTAKNGKYLGLFQMGKDERKKYGHGPGSWRQARAAFRYFVDSGKDWSPWTCKPW